MALSGIKILEFAGLAPAPFCGMILSDFGADVIRINRTGPSADMDPLARGKRSIAVDLKHPKGVDVILHLSRQSDVLLEPFRPGVMEKLGLGPKVLMKENEKLIYARLTGYGQTGPLADRAGHDINYLGISGVLSMLGTAGQNPTFPVNLLADFAGGGLTCAFGIVMALFERTRSGLGQIIDSNMVEGGAYVSSFLWRSRHLPLWGQARGKNVLDGGSHFYNTYETSDGKYMAVGAIEPQFYARLLQGLGLSPEDAPQIMDFDEGKKMFSEIFSKRTQSEWTHIFEDTDACVTPIVEWDEACEHRHNQQRNAFMASDLARPDPIPAPRLGRTPASFANKRQPIIGEHTTEVLKASGYSQCQIEDLLKNGIIEQRENSKL